MYKLIGSRENIIERKRVLFVIEAFALVGVIIYFLSCFKTLDIFNFPACPCSQWVMAVKALHVILYTIYMREHIAKK